MATSTAATESRGRPKSYNSTSHINRDASPTRGTGRSLSLRVKSASAMHNPIDQLPLTDPIIHFGLGKLSKSMSVKGAGGSPNDRFSMSESSIVQMPYNGESILRLMLSDGVYQCGWAEIAVDKESLRADGEIPVVLKSRVDPTLKCGNMILLIKRTSTKIQPDVVIDRTPLHATQSKIPSQVQLPPTAPQTPASAIMGGGVVPPPPASRQIYKSTKTHITNLNNLSIEGIPCKKPYVVLQQGDVRVRGPIVHDVDQTGSCSYNQIFTLPIPDDKTEYLDILCYDNNKLAKEDPLIGSIRVPINTGKETQTKNQHHLHPPPPPPPPGATTSGGGSPTTTPVSHPPPLPCGSVDYEVSCSMRPEPTGRVIEYIPPEPVSMARSQDDDDDGMVSSNSALGGVKENLVSKGGSSVNSICVIVAKHFDPSSNAFIKVKLGKDELRSCQFSDLQGDQLIFPYHSERYMHFTAQQDRKAQRDPVIGEYSLDLSPIISKEEESSHCAIELCHPSTGAGVGKVHVIIKPSSDTQTKPHIKPGPNLMDATTLQSSAGGGKAIPPPTAIQISMMKIIDPPNQTPGHEYKIQAEYGKDNLRISEPIIVNPNGELMINQSYLCNYQKKKYAKITLIDGNAEEQQCGSCFLDLDALLKKSADITSSSHALSCESGTILLKVDPLTRKMQNSRFIQNEEVNQLKSCEGLEVRVLAAYDLVYESTQDVLDPYCCIKHGKTNLEGKQQKNAGLNPIIMNTFTLPLEPGEPVQLSLHDKAMLHKDTLIGSAVLDIDDLSGQQQQLVVLMKNNNPTGTVLCTVKGLPKSKLTSGKGKVEQDKMDEYKGMHSTDLIKFNQKEADQLTWPGLIVSVHCAQRLGGAQYDGKEKCEGSLSVINGSNKVDAKAQKITNLDNAQINEYFAFPKTNSRIMRFDVYDQKFTGKKIIGSGNVDIAELLDKIQLVKAAKRPHASKEILRRVDSDDLKNELEDISLDKSVVLRDDYGRLAGILIVTIAQAASKIDHASAIDAPITTSPRHKIPTCTTNAASCRVHIVEGDEIDPNYKAWVSLDWFNKNARTRVCSAQNNKLIWQDDILVPCLPAQKTCTFYLNKEGREPVTFGVATIPDLEAILNRTQPTDRWVLFHKVNGTESDLVGKVHMIFRPSASVQHKLQTVHSAESVEPGTYQTAKLSLIRVYDLSADQTKNFTELYPVIRHDTISLKGNNHYMMDHSADIMETSVMPIHPNSAIDLNVIGANDKYGDFHLGAARIHYPDLTVKQNVNGTRCTAPIYLQGKYTGTIDYVLKLTSDKTTSPKVEQLDPNTIPAGQHPVPAPASRDVPASNQNADTSNTLDGRPLFKGLDIEVVKIQDVPLKSSSVYPYVYVILGSIKLRGHTLESNTTGTCAVGDLFKLPIQPVEFVKFEVYDDQKMRRDPVLASAKLSLATLVCNEKYNEIQRLKLPLFKSDGSAGGNLFMKVRGHSNAIYTSGSVETVPQSSAHPATEATSFTREVSSDIASSHGTSKITVPNCPYKSLRVEILNTSHLTNQKSSLFVTGRLGEHSLRTRSAAPETTSPSGGVGHHATTSTAQTEFGDEFYFPYHGEKKMKLTLYDEKRGHNDEEIGYCKIDLEPVLHSENKGEAQYMTGYLVNKKTGDLTNAEITVLISPQLESIAKATVLSDEIEDPFTAAAAASGVPSPDILGSCLTLTDLKITDLPQNTSSKGSGGGEAASGSGGGGVGSKLNPYIILRLGRAKLRTDKPIGGVRFDDSLEYNMTKLSPSVKEQGFEFLVMDNIKFHIDAKLGKAKLDLSSLKSQDGSGGGSFMIPLLDYKSGKPNGAKVSGEYFWSQKIMEKKACLVPNLEAENLHEDVKDSLPLVAKQDRPSSYIITVQPTKIQNSQKPYIEMTFESSHTRSSRKLRFDHPFIPETTVTEIGKIPASSTNTNCRLTIKDNLKMKIDPVLLTGVLDLSTLKVNEKKSFYVKCFGKKGYQEIEFDVTGSNAVIDKPTIQEIKNSNSGGQAISGGDATTTSIPPGGLYGGKYGAFSLEIVSLSDLSSVHFAVKNDPYVKVVHGNDSASSDVFEGAGNNVTINTCFTMPLNPAERECLIYVMDKETIGKDIIVGTAKLDLTKVYTSPGARQQLSLSILNSKQKSSGLIKGSIKLELKDPNDPTPIRPKIVKVSYA